MCRLARLAFPSQHLCVVSTVLVSVPCPHPCSGFPRGEGRRTPRHCSQGSCLLQGLLSQQLPLCKGTLLLGWGLGGADSSGAGAEKRGPVLLRALRGSPPPSKAQREDLQPLGTPVPLASHSSCLCVSTHLCFLGHLLRGPGQHILSPPPALLLTPSKYLCQPWAMHGRAQWHAGEREGRS